MKILMVNYEYPPIGGGGGVISRDLAEGLVREGHEVAVVTSRFRDYPDFEQVNGVSLYRVPVLLRRRQNVASLPSMLSYVPSAIRQGSRLLNAGDFDLINTHFAIPSGPAGYFLSRRFGIPNVLHLLGGDVYDPSKWLSPHRFPFLKATVRKMIRSADRVVTVSSDIQHNARRFYGTEGRIDVVPPAVRPARYPAVSRAALGMADNSFVLITVGRLVRRKNLFELLQIFAELRSRIACELWIVGDGPLRESLEAQAQSAGIGEHVTFTGRVSERRKFELLAAADLYVSTALHEGFGIVFLEAMECGLPVVCYDRGGQTDFLIDGATGYVVNFSDTETFMERCLSLEQDRKSRLENCEHNVSYVKDFYPDKFVQRHLDLFQKVVRGG
ncbi:MAG: glycosyltransferase family 4 protein [Arenicellales bacterium]